jgi:transcriptional/translational regulatory protein YebC/TACO1
LKLKAEDEEAVLEVLLNADVDVMDIENENGHITVFAPNTDYGLARQALCDNFGDDNDEIDFETDIIQFLPQVALSLEGEDVEVFDRLLDLLNDLDDVQDVYHNVEA